METIGLKLLGGEVHMTITEYNHIHVDFTLKQVYDNATSSWIIQEHQRIIVRGVGYQGGIHMYRWADGNFHVGQEEKSTYERRHCVYLKRSDWLQRNRNNEDPSETTRDKIIVALECAVQTWRRQYPQISEQAFLDAELASKQSAENQATRDRDEAYKNYQEAEKALRVAAAARQAAEVAATVLI